MILSNVAEMLHACRVLSPVRPVIVFRPFLAQKLAWNVQACRCPVSTGFPIHQKTVMLEELRNIKSNKRKPKKPKLTSGVISVDGDGFQELKARVIKIRAAQLDLLGEQCSAGLENPADIIPSCLKKLPFSCDKCGKGFKSPKGLSQHSRKGNKCYDPLTKKTKLVTSSTNENYLLETYDLENINSELRTKNIRDIYAIELESSESLTKEPHKVDEINVQEKESSQEVRKLHNCEFCKRDFKNKAALAVHKSRSAKCQALQRGEGVPTKEKKKKKKDVEQIVVKKDVKENENSAKALTQQQSKEVDIKEKQEILVAYFDTLVSTGRLKDALEEWKLLKANSDGKAYVESIAIYDRLLRGFGRKNDFEKIQEIWKDLVACGLQPSIDSYVSAMMSFDNKDSTKNVFRTIFLQVYDGFISSGFTVDKALKQGNFLFDDKKRFITVVSKLFSEEDMIAASQDEVSNPLLVELEKVGSNNLKSPLETVLEREDLDPLLKRQLEMEISHSGMSVTVPSIMNRSEFISKQFRKFTSSLEAEWRHKVRKAVTMRIKSKKLKTMAFWSRGSTINMCQFLNCVPLEQLVDIILARATSSINSENFSLPVSYIISLFGTDVMNAYHINLKTSETTASWSDYLASLDQYYDWYCDPQGDSPSHREAITEVTRDQTLNLGLVQWPKSVRAVVGQEMLQIMLQEIHVDRDNGGNVVTGGKVIDSDGNLRTPAVPTTSNPAFFKIFRKRQQNKDVEELKPHPTVSKLYDINALVDLKFPATDLPMLVPPLPWVSADIGGYLLQESRLVRCPEGYGVEQDLMISSLPPGGLNPIIDSINQLSAVPWIVNKRVLDLASTLFVDQKDTALLGRTDLPLHPDYISAPTLSNGLKDVLSDRMRLTQEQAEEYRTYLTDKALHSRDKSERFSLWCTTLYRLSLAKHFQEDILWFPHNIDFRGRSYPMPSQLNHMGSDLPRSILMFAKGKKLGVEGFTWLKLHCINLTGTMKKESISARLEFADTILPKMLESARTPLEGERWWLGSDDPWQTFSACVEIERALSHPSGPADYSCHLPIHQDGSCNGLQHYAALGRDLLGARAVNLVPAGKPQDVYSEIAAIVDRKRGKDSEVGVEIATALQGFIKRKVVKQTVMTTVYGVTKYGATLQIAKQLKDTDDFPLELVDQASKYLSSKTFESLNEMFTASQEIQDWFNECAQVIAKDCKSNVSWVTPLGFPVSQPYSKLVMKHENNISMNTTNLFKLSPRTVKKEAELKVNTMKNKNGFAPNFIHSLDSSHMMLTSLNLWSQGVTFASVHDCFWTHATDVEAMNKVCRDQFIALHSFPILEQLSDHFMENYCEVQQEIPLLNKKVLKEETLEKMQEARETEQAKRVMLFRNVPKQGELDLGVVNDSTYFFS